MGEAEIGIRPYDPETEDGFVVGTWLRSYLEMGCGMRPVKAARDAVDAYFADYRQVVLSLMGASTILVADLAGVDGVQVGYTVVEHVPDAPSVHHWTYIKRDYRRMGYAQRLWDAALLSDGPVRYTHREARFAEAAGRRGWVYTPWLAFAHWRGRAA